MPANSQGEANLELVVARVVTSNRPMSTAAFPRLHVLRSESEHREPNLKFYYFFFTISALTLLTYCLSTEPQLTKPNNGHDPDHLHPFPILTVYSPAMYSDASFHLHANLSK